MEMPAQQVKHVAKLAWKGLLAEAKNGHKTTSKDGREGFIFTVRGGSARFIKEAAKEAYSLRLDKNQVDEIREIIKQGGNLRTLGQVEGGKGSRLFISMHWQDNAVVERAVAKRGFNARETGQSPGGETKAPVEKSLFDVFCHEPLGDRQAEFLATLFDKHGGKVHDPRGFSASGRYGFDNHALRSAERRGLVKTKLKNQRRFELIELTPQGRWVVNWLPYVQQMRTAASYYLALHRSFRGSSAQKTTREFGAEIKRFQETTSTIGQVMADLEHEGLIEVDRSEGGYHLGYRWIGAATDVPGVMTSKDWDALYRPALSAVTERQEPQSSPERPEPLEETKADPQPTSPSVEDQALMEVLRSIEDRMASVEKILAGETTEEVDRALSFVDALERISELAGRVERGEFTPLRAVADIQVIATHVLRGDESEQGQPQAVSRP